MDVCSLSGGFYFIVFSCDAVIADVVGDGVIEEDCVLGYDFNVGSEGDLGYLGLKDYMFWFVRFFRFGRNYTG